MTAAEIGIAFVLLAVAVGNCGCAGQRSGLQFDLGLLSVTVHRAALADVDDARQQNNPIRFIIQ
ncbi:hypothetical protein [Halioxenophilus aromaticivorans]|uniref:Uncharacterized protein n=1 Tax=Halioxenophilus aromaticivorans TaxID=1306992 RepID=A0AAV3U0Q4_9ALTE